MKVGGGGEVLGRRLWKTKIGGRERALGVSPWEFLSGRPRSFSITDRSQFKI